MSGSDDVARWINKRVLETEKSMALLQKTISGCLRDHERLRKRSLKLSGVVRNFADHETPNIRTALHGISEALEAMEYHRKHDRMESRAKQPLGLYKVICKGVREELKLRENAVSKELKKQKALDAATIKMGTNKAKIVQSQLELAGANQELLHTNVALAENIERFELKKINDIRTILQEMLYSEMVYHAKSLEILTAAQNILYTSNMEEDLVEVRDRIKLPSMEELQQSEARFKKLIK